MGSNKQLIQSALSVWIVRDPQYFYEPILAIEVGQDPKRCKYRSSCEIRCYTVLRVALLGTTTLIQRLESSGSPHQVARSLCKRLLGSKRVNDTLGDRSSILSSCSILLTISARPAKTSRYWIWITYNLTASNCSLCACRVKSSIV